MKSWYKTKNKIQDYRTFFLSESLISSGCLIKDYFISVRI